MTLRSEEELDILLGRSESRWAFVGRHDMCCLMMVSIDLLMIEGIRCGACLLERKSLTKMLEL